MAKRLEAFVGWFVDVWPRLGGRGGIDWSETWDMTRLMWRWRLHGWITCRLSGHDWYPDHCGRREHDLCSRCEIQRSQTIASGGRQPS